jgi:hypothetical protein
MLMLYAEDIIRPNIKSNYAGELFFYARQETLGPQIVLQLDILRFFDILLLIVLVKS